VGWAVGATVGLGVGVGVGVGGVLTISVALAVVTRGTALAETDFFV
jgi:hypothetical protein